MMASGLCGALALVLCVLLIPCDSLSSNDCQSYRDISDTYHSFQKCKLQFCCGTCYKRYCCWDSDLRLSEDDQEDCVSSKSKYYVSPMPMVLGIGGFVTVLLIFICCCVCPCCCLYKMCRKPRPVIATTTHTTVVTSTPQHYPQQPTAAPAQPQYPPYQSVPVQPGYGPQPPHQGYGAQPPPHGYGAQPPPQGYGTQPPYPTQPFTPGPPPTYQEATGPGYPPQPMPYSQAAYGPGQPTYPLQPPVQPQANAPPAGTDYLAQPAFNPDYVAPPPKLG